MSCLPIVSDRAATEGSEYFELGRQPHEFLTRNTCFIISSSNGELNHNRRRILCKRLQIMWPKPIVIVSIERHNSILYSTYAINLTKALNIHALLQIEPKVSLTLCISMTLNYTMHM